ncbi:MAG: glycosyltransferase family A protein, partial [Solirubrobacterales bacterium]
MTAPPLRAIRGRPSVSVVIPFRGDARDAAGLGASLETGPFDGAGEVIVADNSDDGAAVGLPPPVLVVPARTERSSYHARNAGAGAAAGDWLLFVDADCVPPPDLIGRYFAEPIGERCGAVAGGIVGVADQDSL